MIYAEHVFHPVGHGTFFTGQIWSTWGPTFTWVYDCGSKRRRAALEKALVKLENLESWPTVIDLFVISHFDDDHVNGFERFLENRSIKWLVLPYMDIGQKIEQAASLTSEPCSASTALFQLDPNKWLESHGLSDRVETILYIEGGSRKDDEPDEGPDDSLPPTDHNGERDARAQWRLRQLEKALKQPALADVVNPIDSTSNQPARGPRSTTLLHNTPFSPDGSAVEFMFYNSDQVDLFLPVLDGHKKAKRSGATIQTVEEEVNSLMQQYRLNSIVKKHKRGWREALKALYAKHFGRSNTVANNISLCVLSRLLVPSEATCLRCHLLSNRPFCHCHCERQSVLCLGDLKIDGSTISSMQDHYGANRWRTLGVVQVPHHGSCHSWEAGNAEKFNPLLFVHCVPEADEKHPHELVSQDLKKYRVRCANYTTPVRFSWHMDFGSIVY
ncbi:hypothetical protein [Pseudomonas syringae]|uniref:hypothetical protein n=1 Tax=Pseudomonas syringae TaxID=317 RepID=UPI000AB4A84D|nr:hypothetical protein [Pseudomonas syringae]